VIKLIIVGRCARDKTREAAHRHMRFVHGPMVYAPPPDAGPMPRYYAQNPAFDDDGALPPAWRAGRDFVTEVGFDDFAHLRAATSTPYYLDRLRPDESNFVDPSSVCAVATRQAHASGAEGATRLFVFLKRRCETADLEPALAALADDAAVTGRAGDVALPAPDGRPSPFDSVERFSFADRAAALDFTRRKFASFAEALAPHLEAQESFAILADHHSVERLKSDPPPIRRIVTGHDPQGRATIASDGPLPTVVELAAIPGTVFHEVWSTQGTPAPVGNGADPTRGALMLPPPRHGTRIRFVDIPPDTEEFLAHGAQRMHEAFSEIGDSAASTVTAESPHPLMHRTQSIDYGVVIEGEMTLVLDTTETRLRRGDVVIQRGTNHAWANRSGKPCRMLFVLVDGKFDADIPGDRGP
jgi:mannose-6-phosphate isomerase-like protein (cupin superfamily)